MKWLKYTLIALTALVLLVVGAMVTVLIVVDPNEYKPQITQLVRQATGRELNIDGDLKLSVFPWLGLKLGETQLSNAAGFDEGFFARLQAVNIKIELLPLLRGETRVGQIELKGLTLNLARNHEGVSNWDDLLAETGAEAADTPTKEPQPAAQSSGLPMVTVGGIRIENANIYWRDAQAGVMASVEAFHLNTGPLQLDQPLSFETYFTLKSTTPKLQAAIGLDGTVHANLQTLVMRVEPFNFKITLQESEFMQGKQSFTGKATIVNADLNAQRYGLQGLQLQAQLSGVAGLQGEQALQLESDIQADLSTQQYALPNLQLTAELAGDAIPQGRQSIQMNADIKADLNTQQASIKPLMLKVLGLEIEMQLEASRIIDAPAFNAELQVKPFSPKALLAALDQAAPPTADAGVLQHAALRLNAEGDLQKMMLSQLDIKLDDSTISGNAQVTQLTEQPAFEIALSLDSIDADRYLPPALEQSETPQPDAPVLTGDEPIELPVDMLRSLYAKGMLNIGTLKVMNMRVSHFEADVQAEQGLLQLNPLNVDLYDGRYRGDAFLDVREATPRYGINIALEGVQSQPLLDDFMQDSPITGMLNLHARLNTQGESINGLKKNLHGAFDFGFLNGSLKGVNLGEKLREAQAKLRREEYVPSENAKRTDFAALLGEAVIDNGIVNFGATKLEAPVLRAYLKNKVDLVKEELNLRADVYVVGTKTGQGGKSLDEVKDIFVPVNITGKFTEPKIEIDFKEMLGLKQSSRLQQQQEATRQRLEAEQQAAREKMEREKQILEKKRQEERAHLEAQLKKEQEALERKKAEERQKLKDKLKDKLDF